MGGQVQYLDLEIANEGESADAWQPFVTKPNIPTYEGIKSIRKYFPQFSGVPYKHQAFPLHLYHQTKPPVLARHADEARQKFGVEWREATHEERSKGFPAYTWDYSAQTPGSALEGWRTVPYHTKFDPMNPDTGKEVRLSPDKAPSQSEMIAAVVAAVVAQMGGGKGNALAVPVAAAVVSADYAEFLAFKAWKTAHGKPADGEAPAVSTSATLLSPVEEKNLLIEAANTKGVKVNKGWSIDQIKRELDKIPG